MVAALQNLIRSTGRCFVAGVLALLPFVVTVAVVGWVADLLYRFIGPGTWVGGYIRRLGFGDNAVFAYLTGASFVLACVFALGVLVKSGAQRLFTQWFDGLFAHIPLIGPLYGTSRQLVALFEAKDSTAMKGMSVVFCKFGEAHGAGVLALLVSPQVFHLHGRDYQIVMIPTAPVPIGGGLILLPKDSVLPTGLSLDAFMSIYISMGVTMPQFIQPQAVEKPA